jgi:hypothetical protein
VAVSLAPDTSRSRSRAGRSPPGSAGPQTFYASGETTDSFRGTTTTEDFTKEDTGIPAVPGHYSTDEILGFEAPPGVALQIQVAFRPAK